MTQEVRRLPLVIRPLPDEPFDSWFEAMAHAHDATVCEMAIALGLLGEDGTWRGGGVTAAWAIRLDAGQASTLEAATGIAAEEFHQMTRVRFWQFGARHARNGSLSGGAPVAGNGGRFCPECLADDGGRWRMSWQLPTGFACLRHRRLLADTCAACGLPPRRRGHPGNLIPRPGHCHNRASGTAVRDKRCRGDLTADAHRIEVGGAVLDAQRTVFRTLSSGRASFGIYAQMPQPALVVLDDLRLLARLGRNIAQEQADLVSTDANLPLAMRFQAETPLGDWTKGRPERAASIAVGVTLAIEALQDRESALRLLNGRLSAYTTYSPHTPQLQELMAASLGRRRRPTAVLQSASIPAADPAATARKLPIMLWDAWARRLVPRRTNREIAATALSAAVTLAGTPLTHAAALQYLDPQAPSGQVTQVMRQLGQSPSESGTIVALIRLAEHLAQTDVPIDYSRRRALDCEGLLPRDQWVAICRECNVHPGSVRRYVTAKHYLFQRITGSPLLHAPTAWRDRLTVNDREVGEFGSSIPALVRAALTRVGREFLATNDIQEPLEWQPSHELVADLDLPPAPAGEGVLWPVARPARDIAAPTARAMQRAYRAGATMRELSEQAGLSRQTIARVLHDIDTDSRIGRPREFHFDPDWLRDRYIADKLTIAQIADQAGCSTTLIRRSLRKAGIEARDRGTGSTVAMMHPHPLAGDSSLLRKVLIGRNGVQRAQRYLAAVGQPSMRAAASSLGAPVGTVRAQLKRIAHDAGGPLFQAAVRGGPLTLTARGETLATELRRAFRSGDQCYGACDESVDDASQSRV